MMRRCGHCKKRHVCSPGRKKPARERRDAKATLRLEYMASLRTDVFRRAEEVCELCGEDAPTELHHLEGGSGRRALQAVENCMAACVWCHRWFHLHPEEYRPVVLSWCERYRYPIPRRFRGEPKLPLRALEASVASEPKAPPERHAK